MRSVVRKPISVAPGVYDSPAQLAEIQMRLEHWQRSNPNASRLSDRFDDLVYFEVPLRGMMRRISMFVRQGFYEAPPFSEADLHRAANTWRRLEAFYDSDWRVIARDVRCAYDRSYDDLNGYIAECTALEPHRNHIEAAHHTFGDLLSALLKMGYSYSTIAPNLGRRYYRFRDT